MQVDDDGTVFDPSRVPLFGLRGLRDRVEALGGTLEIAGRPHARIACHLPTTERARV